MSRTQVIVTGASRGIGAAIAVEIDLNREFLASEKVQRFMKKRIPTGGVGTVEDVARLVGALMACQIPFLTGETIYIDGGQGINH